MSQSIQDLRERRSVIAKALHDLLEERGDDWGDEHQGQYDQGMAEIKDLEAHIERIEALHERIAEQHTQEQLGEEADRLAKDKGKRGASLFAKWLRGGDKALSAEEWTEIRAALSTGTDSEGGYTVPTDVADTIADALKAYGGMREAATVITTEMGNPINYPTSDGTAEEGELIAENTTATEEDPSFGVATLNTYKFSSKIVPVPFELLQDSAVDIEAFVRGRLIQRIGRITNRMFTTGTGTAQPQGLAVAAGAGVTGATGQTTTVTFDDLLGLYHSVDPAYRRSERCAFMMADSSLQVVRSLKDTQGRPIYLPGYEGLAGAMPESLMGRRVVINQDVAAMAANARSILFGDMAKYIIRDVMAFTLFRFTDSAYIKLGQIGFLMWSRNGGVFVDVGGAVKYYQNSAT